MSWWRGARALCLIALVASALALAACGGGGSSDASADSAGGPESLPLKSRPNIEPGRGLPPKKLVVKDLWEGDGAEAERGDQIKIQYYGVHWRDGAEHANS